MEGSLILANLLCRLNGVEEIELDLWKCIKRVEMFLKENAPRRLGMGPTPDMTATTLKDVYQQASWGVPPFYRELISVQVASLYAACQDACPSRIPPPVAHALYELWVHGVPQWRYVDVYDLGPYFLVAAFFHRHAYEWAAFHLETVRNAVLQRFCFASVLDRDLARGALLMLLQVAQNYWGDHLVLPGSMASALLHLLDRVATTTVFYNAPEEDSAAALQMVVV
jgi:hypothetical protein